MRLPCFLPAKDAFLASRYNPNHRRGKPTGGCALSAGSNAGAASYARKPAAHSPPATASSILAREGRTSSNARALTISTALSAPFALLVFGFRSLPLTILGAALWGVGMGAQESILKAAVSAMVPKQSRAAGYGLFECAFGCFWFLGSWLCGVLYEISLSALIAVSAGAQTLAILFYIFSASAAKKEKAA